MPKSLGVVSFKEVKKRKNNSATHNFGLVKITHICLISDQTFASFDN